MTMLDQHRQKVQQISAEIRERVQNHESIHIDKGGVPHFVPIPGNPRRTGHAVKIGHLNQIISIDPQSRICHAEPGVTFAEVLRATLEHGLIPTVVPELEGISLGGAVVGCSVESMSYRYGGFHDGCIEYEIITGDGRVLECSRDQNAFEFEMIHGSYGTLGILAGMKFRLVPAKRFVRMEYRKSPSFADFERGLRAAMEDPSIDFVDAIVHGPREIVLCLGRFVDEVPYLSSYRWLNIFYRSTRERSEDYLTTFDYCFRYDTECHWLNRTIPILENKLFRLLFGKLYLGSTQMIRWSRRIESLLKLKERPDVVCDVFIPLRRFGEFFSWYERDFDFYPLWVIPYRAPQVYPWIAEEHGARIGDDFLIDCAIYGKTNRGEIDYSELLENKTYELNGLKTLISQNHHTRERFWQIFHPGNYQKAKGRLDPNGIFPDLYDKMHKTAAR